MRHPKSRYFVVGTLACIALLMSVGIASSSTRRKLSQGEQVSVIKAVAPTFPPVARAAWVKGVVEVEVTIDNVGTVTSAHSTSGHRLLRAAAETATKQWMFAPATESKMARKVSLSFTFTIMPECTKYADLTPIFVPPYQVEIRVEPAPVTCDDCAHQPDPCKHVKR
ncbi:MAG: periplasmic protein TonB [Acidobacteriota bacterium]|nr:periplasmic protein TonB [Acidobacteriota bacterium]